MDNVKMWYLVKKIVYIFVKYIELYIYVFIYLEVNI